jgi:hypothetical protein
MNIGQLKSTRAYQNEPKSITMGSSKEGKSRDKFQEELGEMGEDLVEIDKVQTSIRITATH